MINQLVRIFIGQQYVRYNNDNAIRLYHICTIILESQLFRQIVFCFFWTFSSDALSLQRQKRNHSWFVSKRPFDDYQSSEAL